MFVSGPSPAASGVGHPAHRLACPGDSLGAYNASSCGREMVHNALENYLEIKPVVSRLA